MYVVTYKKGYQKIMGGVKFEGWVVNTLKEAERIAGEMNALYPSNIYTIYKLKKIKTLHYAKGKY